MEISELPQWQFQIAMLIGLITFTMVWARGMRRYTPIQDLSQAYKALIIGFIGGAILASALDIWVFRRMYEDLATDSLYLVEMGVLLLLAGWAEGALCVYLCSRSERKVTSAATTTGYAFGIGSAAMTTAVAAVRIFDPALAFIGSDVHGFGLDTVIVSLLIGISAGFTFAPLGSAQGALVRHKQRFTPLIISGIGRAAVRLCIYLAVLVTPLALGFGLALSLWLDARANNRWLPSSLTPLQLRVERRILKNRKIGQSNSEEE